MSNDVGAVTVMVPAYISMLSTLQPVGTLVAEIEVMLLLSNDVVPLAPGVATRIPLAGTVKLLVSSLLHDVSDAASSAIEAKNNVYTIFLILLFYL